MTPFLKTCTGVLFGYLLVQAGLLLWMLADPAAFHFRAWEYFFRWSNATSADDRYWNGEELPGLSRRITARSQS